MNTAPTAVEANAWFSKEIQELRDSGFVKGELAEPYFEDLETQLTNFTDDDDIKTIRECVCHKLYDDTGMRSWLEYETDFEDLINVIDDFSDLNTRFQSNWLPELKRDVFLRPGDMMKQIILDYLTKEIYWAFDKDWQKEFHSMLAC